MRPKRFVRRRLSAWLAPALLAPVLGAWLWLFLRAWFFGGSRVGLLAWMPIGTGVALLLGVCLLLTDLSLVALRLRLPPTGWRAWVSGSTAAVVTLILWDWLRPVWYAAAGRQLFALALSVVAAAVLTRLFTSPRPRTGFRFVG